jgi:hypothetical protein
MTTVIHAHDIELLGQVLAAIADEIEIPGGTLPSGKDQEVEAKELLT